MVCEGNQEIQIIFTLRNKYREQIFVYALGRLHANKGQVGSA